ncbi:hypothetical protein RRG08_018771 [Elysia crispata]|uniref:Uncharacterized protein n=1 Tax=Elysia crispata TaxID=231223 RepID=A0AAE0ZWX9_9GAST|nr:hypothetical protein RRG08_018771 [Elysia crispata]
MTNSSELKSRHSCAKDIPETLPPEASVRRCPSEDLLELVYCADLLNLRKAVGMLSLCEPWWRLFYYCSFLAHIMYAACLPCSSGTNQRDRNEEITTTENPPELYLTS